MLPDLCLSKPKTDIYKKKKKSAQGWLLVPLIMIDET